MHYTLRLMGCNCASMFPGDSTRMVVGGLNLECLANGGYAVMGGGHLVSPIKRKMRSRLIFWRRASHGGGFEWSV